MIALIHQYVDHIGFSQDGHCVGDSAGRLAACVPGDQHAATDACELAGIGYHEYWPARCQRYPFWKRPN
jgi:hypothetical protein